MIQFSLFGIPIRVEPLFWLTIALLGGVLHADSAQKLLNVAMFVLAGFVSILVHELGHALTIRKYKLPTQIVLTAFGGYATHPVGALSRKQSFIVTLMGPLVQILLGVLVYYLWPYLPTQDGRLGYFFWALILVSFVWALLNCLPIFPLDGGQMLAAILGPRRAKGLHLTGMVAAVAVGALALSAGYMLVAIFMGLFAYQNYQYYQQSRY